jgi:hypothetical protein
VTNDCPTDVPAAKIDLTPLPEYAALFVVAPFRWFESGIFIAETAEKCIFEFPLCALRGLCGENAFPKSLGGISNRNC